MASAATFSESGSCLRQHFFAAAAAAAATVAVTMLLSSSILYPSFFILENKVDGLIFGLPPLFQFLF